MPDTAGHLEPSTEPRWLLTRNARHSIIEAICLPPGSDLREAFERARVIWNQAGWAISQEDPAMGRFVCTQGSDLRTVAISSEPPGPRGRMRQRGDGYGGDEIVESSRATSRY
jgi:hypothetical protein